jgi:predicted dinucleotide-binding enzyme
MDIGVIGAGSVGGNLVRRLTKAGHHVSVANSRGPDTLKDLAAETGADAVDIMDAPEGADLLIISIPEKNVPDLPPRLLDHLPDDAPVVDTGNYYPRQRDGRIDEIEDGLTESRWVEKQIHHPVIKAFNGVLAPALLTEARPAGDPKRLGVAVAGDDPAAKQKVMTLIDELGFDPVDAGDIEHSWRQQPGTPWYCKGLNADGVRKALAESSSERLADFHA